MESYKIIENCKILAYLSFVMCQSCSKASTLKKAPATFLNNLKVCSDLCPWTFISMIHLFLKAHRLVFLELRFRKTVRFSKQIMSKDKYPSIVLRQMEAVVNFINVSLNL